MFEVFTSGSPRGLSDSIIAKVTRDFDLPMEDRANFALISDKKLEPDQIRGFSFILTNLPAEDVAHDITTPLLHSIPSCAHLNDGDIVAGDGRTGRLRTIYRRGSKHNVLFTTEACNSLCLMCSQPPKQIDPNLRVSLLLKQIALLDPDTEIMCITGGEPTLLGDNLFTIISVCRDKYPDMPLHMLTNGRTFKDYTFSRKYAGIRHPNITAAIPLYADVDYLHDYVVQAEGAFFQTLNGIHNLGLLEQQIEIRIVVHKQTYKRLPQLSEFIFRNMPFVKHITFMGLEITGYTKFNLDSLWIDPHDYQEQLEEAVLALADFGMNVSIYNHQLCILRKSLWPFARASISDWKNVYDEECSNCDLRAKCGGFFKWNPAIRSSHLKAIHF
jgi:His-Xaa-Ser system radical SAM maturase HxsC